MLDPRLLEQYVNTFYGYGNYSGRFWFVGIEEAGAETLEDNASRINIWDHRGKCELEDLVEYHRALGLLDRFLGDHPNIQRTWGRLIRVTLAATASAQGDSELIMPDAVRAYQRDQLGRAAGDTCLIELLPLSARSTGEWMWGERPPLPYLLTRKTYQQYCSPKRAQHIAARIREHKPTAVIFYSVTGSYKQWWERIAGVPFAEITTESGRYYIGDNGQTIFASTAHHADRRPKDSYFHHVGREIASRLEGDRSKRPSGKGQSLDAAVPGMRRLSPHSSAAKVASYPPRPSRAPGFLDASPVADFRVGHPVRHSIFGEGQVLEVAASGQDQVVTVMFETVGKKRLMAKAAKLERI